MASGEQTEQASTSKSPSLMSLIVSGVIATVLAAAGGAGFGYVISGPVLQADQAVHAEHDKSEPSPKPTSTAALIPMTQILTALAEPKSVWIRLEGSLVYDGAPSADATVLAAKIGEDILAYLKVTTVAQIEGAVGFQHLRDDINERARLRSQGKVREVIIQSMIVE